MNALNEPSVVEILYRASFAGVHVLAKRLPRAMLRVFTAGHALANEVPEPLADAATSFLDGPGG